MNSTPTNAEIYPLTPADEAPLNAANKQADQFLTKFRQWTVVRPDILGVALVGSYARNDTTSASDIDLVIIATQPEMYLRDTRWAEHFGKISRRLLESYGKVTSIRVWYSEGLEVEYGLTDETWCGLPLDEGSRKVISNGIQILTERDSLLSKLS